MSSLKATSPDAASKFSTPNTRGFKATKKRTLSTEDADQVSPIEMDLTSNLAEPTSPRPPASDTSSPMCEQPNPIAHIYAPPAVSALPSSAANRLSVPLGSIPSRPAPNSYPGAFNDRSSLRDVCRNLPTCIRLTPSIPQGRMDVVQTGIKLELVISNAQRSLTRGLEDYVNLRAEGCRARQEFTIERIKIYRQGADLVLFGKIGTEFDLRALHYVFLDIAQGSQLRYCEETFPDLSTAVENARPWFNQGNSTALASNTSYLSLPLFCLS